MDTVPELPAPPRPAPTHSLPLARPKPVVSLRTRLRRLWPRARPSRKSVSICLQQMAIMLTSGVQLLQVFESLRDQVTESSLVEILEDLNFKVTKKGMKLSQALRQHPEVFPPYVCLFAKAGEETGDLAARLKRAGELMEREVNLVAQIKAALTTPFLTLFVAGSVMLLTMRFVMPKFISMYEGLKIPLPEITRMVIFSVAVINHPAFQFSLIALAFLIYHYRHTLRERLFELAIKIPLTARWVGSVLGAQFCDILGSLVKEGVPIVSAIKMIAHTAPYRVHRENLLEVHHVLVEEGDFAEGIQAVPYFPRLIYHLSVVGQEVGSIDQLLTSLGKVLEQDVEHAVATAVNLLEPIMIAIMGVVGAFYFIGMFMPVYGMLQHLGD